MKGTGMSYTLSTGLDGVDFDTPTRDPPWTEDTDRVREPVVCQVCSLVLESLTLSQRQAHYDEHFLDENPGQSTH